MCSNNGAVPPVDLGTPTAVYIFGDKHSDDIKYGMTDLGPKAKTVSVNWVSCMIDVYPQSEAAMAAAAAVEALLHGDGEESRRQRLRQEGAQQQTSLARLSLEYLGTYTAQRDEQAAAAAAAAGQGAPGISSRAEGAAGAPGLSHQAGTAARATPGPAEDASQQQEGGSSSDWRKKCAEMDQTAAAAVQVYTSAVHTGGQWKLPRVYLQVPDPKRWTVPARLRHVVARSLRAELQAGDSWTVNGLTFQLQRVQAQVGPQQEG
jgi:hypothetical protein